MYDRGIAVISVSEGKAGRCTRRVKIFLDYPHPSVSLLRQSGVLIPVSMHALQQVGAARLFLLWGLDETCLFVCGLLD